MRWLHITAGVMWIGLLWYFNFVQTPSMPKIPDDQKPAISKVIAPAALFWFRWAAMATIILGLILALMNGYLVQALTLQKPFTVDRPRRVAGHDHVVQRLVHHLAEPEEGARHRAGRCRPRRRRPAKRAGMASRINTMLSIPMLYFMVAQQPRRPGFLVGSLLHPGNAAEAASRLDSPGGKPAAVHLERVARPAARRSAKPRSEAPCRRY